MLQFPKERLEEAIGRLREYKRAKAPLEKRLREEELWYQLRHWELIGGEGERPGPTSAWLFNNLANKHADAMDNFPEPVVLPREPGDAKDAEALSRIIPAVLDRCGFEQTYSDQWWYKLKHGTAVYGVFWNPALEHGAGDVDVTPIDLQNIFWEPGVRDIQLSRDLFIAHRWDRETLEKEYPQLEKGTGDVIDVITRTADGQDRVTVIDWYYKKDGLLHLCKFAGEHVLYASELDERCRDTGWYAHGLYPVVFDTLFPVAGEPVGFGYIAVTKAPQEYIDRLGKNIMECSLMASRPRYFAGRSAGINEEEFLDWDRPIVHVEGAISEERVRPIQPYPLSETYLRVQQMKIDELKETSSNRDFSAGSTNAGVTAASAISALQEAGNKTSRDMIRASYRAYGRLGALCLELIRQFYDVGRCFRITGEKGTAFVTYSSRAIRGAHRPDFDIVMTAQKKNPFARVSQNELAKELYDRGFFRPDLAEQAMGALELMDFEGKEAVRAYLAKHLEKEEQTIA
ncbi:MAG: hypothetical protein E7423_03425 [Ruminococcaceae bacterium]|nr:hypothetical protein [Oscillospiraceae bacterium]